MKEHFSRVLDISKNLENKSLFIFGPRQTGKSAFIINQLAEKFAFSWNLLDRKLWHSLQNNPGLLSDKIEIENLRDCVVFIDEIQLCPELLNEIHRLIEERNIRFLMTGSSARKLRRDGVNLLGGRANVKHFHPFCFAEMGTHPNYNLPHIFETGLLPPMFLSENIEDDLTGYVDTYLKEEIITEGLARNIPNFARFLTVAALTNGQILNYSNIASDTALSVQTVKQWYQVLIDTLIGEMLPVFNQTKKRKAIATPKFYFFDIGVVRALKNIPAPVEANAEYGEFFEHLVYMELRAWIDYTNPRTELTYWRTKTGVEVDFCVGTKFAVEAKSTANVTEKHLANIKLLREENIFEKYIVVCKEPEPRLVDGIQILPWKYFFASLWNGKI